MLVELDKGLVSDSMALLGMKLLEVRAVEEMGDPVSVGTELDRIHRPKPQLGLLALTMLLALTGAVPRVALTAGWGAYAKDIDPKKTALAVVLGCGALLLGYFLDYARLSRWGRVLYVGALAVWNDWQEKIKIRKPLSLNGLRIGPSAEIRTRGLLNPIQARYQTSPHPVVGSGLVVPATRLY